jgi:PAS domain S-box-containing protein
MPPDKKRRSLHKRFRVLVIGGSADDALWLKRLSPDGGRDVVLERVPPTDALRAALERGPWDMAITDCPLQQLDESGALQLLKRHAPDFPLLTIADTAGVKSAGSLGRDHAGEQYERQQMEAALRQSEERLERIIETTPGGIVILDTAGAITFANAAAERILGPTRSVIIGRRYNDPVWKITTVDGRPIPDEQLPFVRAIRAGQPVLGIELAVERPDGDRVILFVNLAPLRDLKQQVIGVVASFIDITERHAMEKELRESEERFRAVVEDQTELICRFKTDGTLTFVNEVYCRFYAKASGELLGIRWQPRAVAEDLPLIEARLRTLSPANPVVVVENRVYSGSGEVRWMQFVNRAFFNQEGRRVETQAVGRDITERKRAEEAVRESKERLQLVLDASNDGLWDWDMRSGLAYLSPRYYEMTGYQPAEVRPDLEFYKRLVHPDDLPMVLQTINTHLEGHTTESVFEHRLITKDGTVKWILGKGKVVERDASGAPLRMVGTISDITAHKHAEAALRKIEVEYRAIFENAMDGIYRASADGRFLAVNPAMAGIQGCSSAGDVLAHSNTATQPWQVAPSMKKEFQRRLREQGMVEEFEYEVRLQNGSVRWVSEKARAIYDAHGAMCFYEGVIRDITGRKQVEEALQESEASARAQADELATVLATTPAITFVARDPSCRVITSSNAALRMLRLPAGANTSKSAPAGERPETFRVLKDGRELTAEELPVQQVAATGRALKDCELTLVFNDGTTRDIIGNAVPLLGADGKVRGAVGAFLDITERKRAELALQESEERFHSLVSSSMDAVLLTAPEGGRTLAANAAACRMFGRTEEELIQVGRDGVMDVTDPRLKLALEHRARTGSFTGELTFVRKDGSKFPGEISTVLFHNRDGELRTSMVIRDITERKQMEEALFQLSGQLLQSQDEERRRIARELHDTTAQQMAALCLGLSSLEPHLKVLKPKARKLFADNAALADECLAEIRTMSYLLHPPLLDELGLEGAVRDYADGFARRSGIRVDLDLPSNMGRLAEEVELALFRILQESLGNIRRHSGSRTAFIRLIESAGEIRLEVQDSGRGTAALADTTGKNAADHLGVGISGMRARLHQLGGRLEIKSSGSGTTVCAILPLTEARRS